jgi:3-methyladenine DNA glycosylase/8-oxoguanine DNA glycosylase
MSVTSLARALAADPTIFGRGASLEDAIAKLRALPGIGEWTAQYIAMRELREPDAFPAADVGLLRAMTNADGQASVARRIALARGTLATVARLCRVASVGGRRHAGDVLRKSP